MINVSKKVGFLTVSSTDAEIVHDGEMFPNCAWFRFFTLAQGDDDNEDILFQDNKSCVQVHNNYPFSIGKGSKHENARCFFVVHRTKKKDFKLVCCPTENRIADYSTKPTQGSLFAC